MGEAVSSPRELIRQGKIGPFGTARVLSHDSE